MGVEPKAVHLSARNEVYIALSVQSGSRETFGSILETPFGVGLKKMASWVKAVGARRSMKFKKIKILRCLPRAWVADES